MYSKIPHIFSVYDNNVSKMPDQNGIIRIELDIDKNQKTFIKHLQSKAPFLIQKAIYPETHFPNFPHIYMMSSSGGILQGDTLQIDILLRKNSSARITNQSATKIYKMNSGYASQFINIQADDESYLEFIPHQIIPFKSSRFYQGVSLKIGKNSTLVYSETIASGRIASGEKFDFDICFLRTQGFNKTDQLLFSDVMKIEGNKTNTELESLFEKKNFLSTIYIINDSTDLEKICEEINSVLRSKSLLAGYSILPHDSGIIVRILADFIFEITDLIEILLNIVRLNTIRFAKINKAIHKE